MVILDIPSITFALAAAPSPTSAITPWIAPVITASAVLVGALLATAIGLMNVRAAQNKVAIDLFDRRLAAYTEISTKIKDVSLHIEKSDTVTLVFGGNLIAHFIALYDAFSQAHFLFGPEVTEYLEEIDSALVRANWSKIKNDSSDPDQGGRFADDYKEVMKLQKAMPAVFEPYMDMRTMAVGKKLKPKAPPKSGWKRLIPFA